MSRPLSAGELSVPVPFLQSRLTKPDASGRIEAKFFELCAGQFVEAQLFHAAIMARGR